MKLTFIEVPLFTELMIEWVDDEGLRCLQNELMANPEKGALIPHSGGLRKVRMRLPGRGKRGSARVIYLYLQMHERIYLVYFYTKGDTENLSPTALKRLRQIAEQLKQEVGNEKQRH